MPATLPTYFPTSVRAHERSVQVLLRPSSSVLRVRLPLSLNCHHNHLLESVRKSDNIIKLGERFTEISKVRAGWIIGGASEGSCSIVVYNIEEIDKITTDIWKINSTVGTFLSIQSTLWNKNIRIRQVLVRKMGDDQEE